MIVLDRYGYEQCFQTDKNTPSIDTGEILMSYITAGQENSVDIDLYYEDLEQVIPLY
jgi:hypothetical protein